MHARSRRILHVFRAPLGGLFRHVVDLARAQGDRGHAVGVLCSAAAAGEAPNPTLENLRPHLALGVTRVPMRRNPHWSDASALVAVQQACRALRPDVLHGHGSKGGAYARLAWSGALDPAIRAYTPHGGSFNYRPGTALHRLYMGAENLLARRTDLFLFESAFVAARFRDSVAAGDRLVRVVHNGVSEAEFAPIAPEADPFDIVYVGELRPAKGVEVLIDALALLRRERDARLTLLVIGSGPSRDALRARAQEAGLGDAVLFGPPQPIRAALARGRVMAIPSLAESLPYVILEAAAAAQPLVSTNVGGIPEIFGPHGGALVRPGDARVFAEALMRKLGESPQERAAQAQALSAFVRSRFSLEGMVDGVLAGYEAAFVARRAGADDPEPSTQPAGFS